MTMRVSLCVCPSLFSVLLFVFLSVCLSARPSVRPSVWYEREAAEGRLYFSWVLITCVSWKLLLQCTLILKKLNYLSIITASWGLRFQETHGCRNYVYISEFVLSIPSTITCFPSRSKTVYNPQSQQQVSANIRVRFKLKCILNYVLCVLCF